MTVCPKCRRQTRNGRPVSFQLFGAAHEKATKIPCVECWDEFEATVFRQEVERRERVRLEIVPRH